MVASIERIEQDIAALEAAIAALAQEFHNTYSGYLEVLSVAVRQQLILASYHVCTQSYPKQFLELSFNQRQQLQQSIRDLANQVQQKIADQLKPSSSEQPEASHESDLSAETQFSQMLESIHQEENDEEDHLSLLDELSQMQTANLRSIEQITRPQELFNWQEALERRLVEELRLTSHFANRLFQQSAILPQKLPEPILEAVVKADAADVLGSTPNLLNLMIEAVGDNPPEKKSEDAQSRSSEGRSGAILQITTIHLRLSEIEFADSTLTVWRTRIRNLSSRLHALGRDYEKKQKERTIAEAEAAWRVSWSDG